VVVLPGGEEGEKGEGRRREGLEEGGRKPVPCIDFYNKSPSLSVKKFEGGGMSRLRVGFEITFRDWHGVRIFFGVP
jgi:hypothetical protein